MAYRGSAEDQKLRAGSGKRLLRSRVCCLRLAFVTLLAICFADPGQSGIRPDNESREPQLAEAAARVPQYWARVHRVGNIAPRMTNWGRIGNPWRTDRDPCTQEAAESLEFPIKSSIDYLAWGGLWIGAVKGEDTLVSIASDGWQAPTEFLPAPRPDAFISQRTNRPVLRAEPNSPCADIWSSPDAISEQDFIIKYYDTITNPNFVNPDPFDGPHRPLGIEVTQSSYAWSVEYAKDFILIDFSLRNIGATTLKHLYMGFFMDQDIGHTSTDGRQEDDISGFTRAVPSVEYPGFSDTINVAWSADNDGDPAGGRFTRTSVTGVVGVRVVKAPTPDLKFSFNWWVTHTNPQLDWGPNRRNSKVQYIRGNLGSPWGDAAKYQLLSNGEFDYDQIESAIDHQADGWMPPVSSPALAANLSNGYDTRYLLSFGPFDLPRDSVLQLTTALVAAGDFHANASNFARLFEPARPELYLQGLDLTGLTRNAQWAAWLYDTPGLDTDGDGYSGRFRMVGTDTVYYAGDGVPDFAGPVPPPAPELRFTTSEGRIVMRWNGRASETVKDHFSHHTDFEGYRVYMSRTAQLADFALLTQRDHVNYVRHRYNANLLRWVIEDPPLTIDSLQPLYNDLVDTAWYTSHWADGTPFHPDSFQIRDIDEALIEVILNDADPSKLDTNHYCFERFSSNEQVDDHALVRIHETLRHPVTGVIRKLYPDSDPKDSLLTPAHDDVVSWPYYEYEYAIDGLQLAEPVYVAVTAFDFGDPAANLSSLESSPLVNATEVWPINSAEVVKFDRPKPGVYPNPYRLADDYNAMGWENPRGLEPDPERARKVTFTNIPDTCVISIWTLDGDLVRRLDHAEHPASSEATVVVWNLITRNTQAVKTGIYIYTIESRFGTDIGKLVIIK